MNREFPMDSGAGSVILLGFSKEEEALDLLKQRHLCTGNWFSLVPWVTEKLRESEQDNGATFISNNRKQALQKTGATPGCEDRERKSDQKRPREQEP